VAHLWRPVDSKPDHLVRGQREGRDRAAFSFHLATDAIDFERSTRRHKWLGFYGDSSDNGCRLGPRLAVTSIQVPSGYLPTEKPIDRPASSQVSEGARRRMQVRNSAKFAAFARRSGCYCMVPPCRRGIDGTILGGHCPIVRLSSR